MYCKLSLNVHDIFGIALSFPILLTYNILMKMYNEKTAQNLSLKLRIKEFH